MSALHIKLLRELGRLWAQVLAIVLVMAAGVATLIIGVGTFQSLSDTRDSYYELNRFADVFAGVTRAPKSVLAKLAEIDGVLSVEARIEKLAMADIEGMVEPASMLLVSLPDVGEQTLNRLYLRTGRMPEAGSGVEAVVSEAFAKAQRLSEGSVFKLLINGALRNVRVTGIALSPDFIYAMAPGSMMPDERRFGIAWLPESELAAAYDLQGAFCNVSVKLLHGVSEQKVIEAVDTVLAPYGGQGAYGRKQQISHAFLDAELTQLQAMSQILPPVFLLVAAFLVNMTLSRLIALEREQIGLMKALGYSSWDIARHYVEFVVLIAAIGTVVGFVLGYWLGNQLTLVYAKFYSFPLLIFSRDPGTYAIAAGVTVGAAVAGAVNAVRKAAWLPPAIAMLPPAPASYHRLFGDRQSWRLPLRQTTVMTWRHLFRWPWRTAGGVIGIAFSVAILVGSLWTTGSMEYMLDLTFNQTDRQDASINFLGAKPLSALYAVERLPGVLSAEPYRRVGVEISHGHKSRRVAIIGRPADGNLTRVLDANLSVVGMPESGLLLSRPLADILGIGLGDVADVKLLDGDRRTMHLSVSAIVEGYLGLSAYMDMDALNRALGDAGLISGTNVSLDPNLQDQLYGVLKETPSAGFIALQTVALKQFRATQGQNLFVMMSVLVGLAGLIAFGVVYNFSRISLSEQGREMASLRVLGFSRGEVSGLLLTEIATVVLIAQPLGWLLGYGIGAAMTKGISSELYSMPFIIGPDVYAYSSIVVAIAALISGLLVRRRVDRLDMIAVLKTRE